MNKRFFALGIFLALIGLWIAGSHFFLRNVEILSYEVQKAHSEYEIREYKPYLVAQTDLTTSEFTKGMNQGFQVLAEYIFGENIRNISDSISSSRSTLNGKNNEVIAMTAPVIKDEQKNTLEFVLPEKYTLKDIPVPKNEAVKVFRKPGGTYAALTYTGLRSEKSQEKYEQKLLNLLDEDGITYDKSTLVSFYYDPPLSFPWTRRNEALVKINQ